MTAKELLERVTETSRKLIVAHYPELEPGEELRLTTITAIQELAVYAAKLRKVVELMVSSHSVENPSLAPIFSDLATIEERFNIPMEERL